MQDTNALFDSLLAAYRNADDPDRFLREFLMRLDDATTNAVVATERKLDRLDAARARLEAAREIPRPDTSGDGADDPRDVEDDREQDGDEDRGEQDGDEDRGEPAGEEEQLQDDQQDVEQAEASPAPKRRKAKSPASESEAPRRRRAAAR